MPRESMRRRAVRWLSYRALSAVVLQTVLLRAVARVLRKQPALARLAASVATRDEVVAVFDRQTLFSSTAHRPNLVAGAFVIGMESGPAHAAQRSALEARLPAPASFGQRAAQESEARVLALQGGPLRHVDIVPDYMAPIAWECLRSVFSNALPALASDDPLIAHLRCIGAHLIVGGVATEPVQARAREASIALDAWVRARLPLLRTAWAPVAGPAPDDEDIVRDAVGVLWVGHPASVQALALVVLDLLRRPEWAALAERARAAADPWQDVALRGDARLHVLESLRFRPPFPLLRRDVVRDGHLAARPPRRVEGGGAITLWGLGAMFDPAAHAGSAPAEQYCPMRKWVEPDDRLLMFGHGSRRCIAREPVVEMLVSALIGLLRLPGLRFADPWWARFRGDGPAIVRMRLRFDT
jgi:cytochrome P450